MQNLYFHTNLKKLGAMPGAMIFTGEQKLDHVTMEIFQYDQNSAKKFNITHPDEIPPLLNLNKNNWININGLHQAEIISDIGRMFSISPLFLEDILNVNQRPKLEVDASYFFTVQKMIRFNQNEDILSIEQISMIVGNNFLITFQETDGDVFDSIRNRILNQQGKLAKSRVDYLAYAILDMIIDHYFIVLEEMGENLEQLEEETLNTTDDDLPGSIQHVKNELRILRRAISPLREVIDDLPRQAVDFFDESTLPYLKDLHDHLRQIMETIDLYRESVAGLLDLHLSSLSTKLNIVMRTLTIIATIFIPLTFVAGVYGMNFANMPELQWRWGYPMVWAVFILCIIAMLLFFRKKKWL